MGNKTSFLLIQKSLSVDMPVILHIIVLIFWLFVLVTIKVTFVFSPPRGGGFNLAIFRKVKICIYSENLRSANTQGGFYAEYILSAAGRVVR